MNEQALELAHQALSEHIDCNCLVCDLSRALIERCEPVELENEDGYGGDCPACKYKRVERRAGFCGGCGRPVYL